MSYQDLQPWKAALSPLEPARNLLRVQMHCKRVERAAGGDSKHFGMFQSGH